MAETNKRKKSSAKGTKTAAKKSSSAKKWWDGNRHRRVKGASEIQDGCFLQAFG